MTQSSEPTRTAIVSGGGGLLGGHIAMALASRDIAVALVDADAAAARSCAEALVAKGGSSLTVTADVCSRADWERSLDTVLGEWGRVDILVNAAGTEGTVAHVVDYPDDVFDRVLAVNLRGTFLGMKTVLPELIKQRGAMVNVASTAGVVGLPGLAAYVASKHAVVGLTRTAAVENAKRGVRINAVCPGPTSGRMMSSLEVAARPEDPGRAAAGYTAAIPAGRYAEAPEVAEVVAFLASPAASYVTGAVLPVDGAMTAV